MTKHTRRPENRTQAIQTLESAKDFIPYPTVVETTHRGERNWDIFSRLLKDRIVFLGTEVTASLAGGTMDAPSPDGEAGGPA